MKFTWMAFCVRITCTALAFALVSMGSPSHLLAGGMNSEVPYVELYAKILRAVDSGKLDKSTGKKARSLNSALQKKILALNDRLNEVKASSTKTEGARQDELFDELVALGGERERLYLDYRNRLEQLVGSENGSAIISVPAAGATPEQAKAKKSVENASTELSKRTFTFENVPEDISTGQFD